MLLRLLTLLCCASLVFAAYDAKPKVVSPAETLFQTALQSANTPEEQVELAITYLDKYPDNIPLARMAQNVLNRKSDKGPEWYEERMNANPTATNRYLWARAKGDPKIAKEQAAWIIEHEPDNFWGYYLMGTAYWQEDEPDMQKVVENLETAVKKDPARYEGFYWLGEAYMESNELDRALEAFKAAAIVDPTSDGPWESEINIYALKKNADKYFDLVDSKLPKDPVTAELAHANGDTTAKPVKMNGDYTVVECFAYW